MKKEGITEIGIDKKERLYIAPSTREFEFIYRAAMEINWNTENKTLYAPKPREWSYEQWYGQIISAAKDEYKVVLTLSTNTKWVNIGAKLKEAICNAEGFQV